MLCCTTDFENVVKKFNVGPKVLKCNDINGALGQVFYRQRRVENETIYQLILNLFGNLRRIGTLSVEAVLYYSEPSL